MLLSVLLVLLLSAIVIISFCWVIWSVGDNEFVAFVGAVIVFVIATSALTKSLEETTWEFDLKEKTGAVISQTISGVNTLVTSATSTTCDIVITVKAGGQQTSSSSTISSTEVCQ